MATPRILIFGGNADQLHQVTELIVGDWSISIFPLVHLMKEAETQFLPDLILLIPEEPADTILPLLKGLQKKFTHIPVVVIAQKPRREDIILAFRSGVRDFLLFPLQPAEFLRILDGQLEKSRPLIVPPPIKRWGTKLWHWLWEGTSGQKEAAGGLGFNLEPDGSPRLFQVEEQKVPSKEVAVRFFGGFRIWVKGTELPLLPGEKLNAFFAYLLYQHEKPIHREVILAKFWKYTPPSSARKSLNMAMHTLRQHLLEFVPDMDFLQYYNDTYTVNPELDIATDVDQFLRFWHKGRAVETSQGPQKAMEHYLGAASLYRGDFMEDIYYEEWCELERDNLKETYLILLDRLGAYFLQEEAYVSAEEVFQKMLEKDACLENIHRRLILCYSRLGRRDKAIRQYYKCAEALQKELNIEPSASTKELFQYIQREKSISGFFF